jgi:hypothetical protein
MEIDSFLDHLVGVLNRTHASLRVEAAATEIASYFGVQPHEIGFFQVNPASRMAYFRWPFPQNGVSIPLKSFSTSLVTATARQRRGIVNNGFAKTPHLHMLEFTLANPEQRIPIQKIMSAPVADGEVLRWIIQVGRKGKTIGDAGPDFTESDLAELEKIAAAIAPLM